MANYISVSLTQDNIWHLLNASFNKITTLKHLAAYKKLYNAYTGNKNNNIVLHPDLVYKPELPDRIEKLCNSLGLDYEYTDIENCITYQGIPIGYAVIRNSKTYFHVDYPLPSSNTEFLARFNTFLNKCTRIKTVKLSPEDVGRLLPNNYYQTVVYVF